MTVVFAVYFRHTLIRHVDPSDIVDSNRGEGPVYTWDLGPDAEAASALKHTGQASLARGYVSSSTICRFGVNRWANYMKAANQNDNECKQCRVLLEASQGRSPFTIFGSPFSLHSSNIVILTVHLKDSGIKVFLQEIFRKRANNPENTVRAVAAPDGGAEHFPPR